MEETRAKFIFSDSGGLTLTPISEQWKRLMGNFEHVENFDRRLEFQTWLIKTAWLNVELDGWDQLFLTRTTDNCLMTRLKHDTTWQNAAAPSPACACDSLKKKSVGDVPKQKNHWELFSIILCCFFFILYLVFQFQLLLTRNYPCLKAACTHASKKKSFRVSSLSFVLFGVVFSLS